jgi:hypothetical protein
MMEGLPEIDGWEFINEFRQAKEGEGFVDTSGNLHVYTQPYRSTGKYPIYHRKRWRAESGSRYYYIGTWFEINTVVECGESSDNTHYHVGNYFQTEQEARQARERVIKALKGE